MKCGPYGTTTDRRETIALMAKITDDKPTADALTVLYDAEQISKMYSIYTNKNIECSQMWVEVYTIDGWLLEPFYGMND